MNMLELQCERILRAACESEYGIVVKTNDPYKARALFYHVRKISGDSEFEHLTIRVSPDDSERELWIIRNSSRMIDLKATDLL